MVGKEIDRNMVPLVDYVLYAIVDSGVILIFLKNHEVEKIKKKRVGFVNINAADETSRISQNTTYIHASNNTAFRDALFHSN